MEDRDPSKSLGQPARLTDLIAYQEGSVVSRTLIHRASGTLTLFAFGVGQGLSEHTAPYDAFVQILDGEAQISVSGRQFRLKEGEMVVMPANEPHALVAAARFKMMLVMIRS